MQVLTQNRYANRLVARQKMKFSGFDASYLKVNDSLNNFKVLQNQRIEIMDLNLVTMEHQVLKNKFIYVNNRNDNNNLLSVNFKTLPKNDKGVPHILEHLATCGSEKFAIRDPFMKMVKRSLNTFMNAMTGPDFTCYPFSSTNQKDFENLMQIYLDISYKPRLRLQDFRQEGWRYDFDEKGELKINGVVFNEMKGVLQDMQSVYYEAILNNIHNNNCYTKQSGGVPNDIYHLPYQEVLDFHAEYYHPSNSSVFMYGNYDLPKVLQYIDQHYYQKYERSQHHNVEQSQKWDQEKQVTIFSQYDKQAIDVEKQGKYSLTFLCEDISADPQLDFSLKVLTESLLNTPSSIFYKKLIESHIAPQYSPGTGYDSSSSRQSFISIGVQDIVHDEQQFSQVDQLIRDTIDQVYKQGIDKDIVQGVLQQNSFRFRKQKSNQGLTLLYNTFQHINHGIDLQSYFKIPEYIQFIQKQLDNDTDYFQQLIKKYLIDNKHILRLSMVPKPDYFQQDLLKEQQFIQQKQQELSEKEIEEIKRLNKELEQQQNTIDNELENILPTLEISDIKRRQEIIDIEKYELNGVKMNYIDINTNGMSYLRVKFDLENITDMHLSHLHMFCNIFNRLGSEKTSYQKMGSRLNLYTTDFDISYHVHGDKQSLILQIGCLDEDMEQMYKIVEEMLVGPDFYDQVNLFNLLQQMNAYNVNNLTENTMSYAIETGSANVDKNLNRFNSLQSVQYLNKVMSKIENDRTTYLEDIGFHFDLILRFIMQKNRVSVCVSSKGENKKNHENYVAELIDALDRRYVNFNKAGNHFISQNEFKLINEKQFYKLPLQVNYCIESIPISRFSEDQQQYVELFARVAMNTLLHREIREKGGAYGSGIRVDRLNGIANIFSYRDPNTVQSYQKYLKVIEEISQGNFNDKDIKEAQLTLFQRLDQPVVNSSKGLMEFIYGIDSQTQQKKREIILDASKYDIVESGRKDLLENMVNSRSAKVIFGEDSENQIQQLEKEGWKVIDILD